MNASDSRTSFLVRLQRTFARMRFLSFSLILHLMIVVVGGSAVLFRQYVEPPDFVAASESFIDDASQAARPPEPMSAPEPTFTPSSPTVSAPPISALATTATSTFAMNTLQLPSKGLDMGAAMESLGKKLGDGAGAGMGRAGGVTGMIFNKKVEAKKLGVILDVSGSAHPHLAGAIQEIEKSFADAILVLTPGCGMGEIRGRSSHEIRKFASIPERELSDMPPERSTASQLAKAFKIDEFEQLIRRPAMQPRLFVSWFEGGPNTGGGTQSSQTLVSFEYLMRKGVDSIYWFADFRDPVNPEITTELLKELKRKKVKVYLHNFAGTTIGPEATSLAEGTVGPGNMEEQK